MLFSVKKIMYKISFSQVNRMAQWVKARAAKSDNWSSIPINHVRTEENLLHRVSLCTPQVNNSACTLTDTQENKLGGTTKCILFPCFRDSRTIFITV